MRRYVIAAFAAVLAAWLPNLAAAQPAPTLVVTVSDENGRAVAGARVDASGGGTTRSAVTAGDGSASLVIGSGLYRVTVAAPSYLTATRSDVTVAAGAVARVTVVLVPSAAPSEIGRTRAATGAASLNTSITADGTIEAQREVQTVGNPTLENYAYQVAGVHYFHSAKSNLDHFKIRGADNEPRTELDGHPLTNTGAGNFLVGWLNAFAFDRIDVEKGVGIAQGDEGRTVFGTIDLVSRGFSRTPSYDAVLGFDSAYGSLGSYNARGALGDGKLQYVFGYDTSGLPDPAHGQNAFFVGPAKVNATPTGALIAYGAPLTESIVLRSETAKLRYAFSPATSLSLGYVGFQGIAAPLGGTYAGYEGTFPIAPCFNGAVAATSAAQCGPKSTYPNPAYAAYTGATQPLYTGYPNGSERNNEPFFEAALQTEIGRGTLSVRPFAGTITDSLVYDTPATPISNLPASKLTSDVLHGLQLSYLYPFSNGYVQAFYSYHSDRTTVYTGAPFTAANLTTPPTTLHENDLSLTAALDVSPRVSLGLGLFSSSSHVDGAIQDPAAIAGGSSPATTPYVASVVRFTHLDPHVGITYRPDDRTSVRASFGSAVYGPGSTLISGRAAFTAPAPSNSNLGLLTLVNPALKPEVTVAYGLGVDRRLGGTVVSLDAYDANIFNKFLTFTYQGGPVVTGGGTLTPLVSQTINASLQRNYGLELEAHRDPAVGLGFDLALSLNRQYFDQIPLSYFAFASAPISPFNYYQGTTNPYSTIHAELRYTTRQGLIATLGSDSVGADNALRAAGFTTMYAALRQRIARGAALQLSAENLFNVQTAAGFVGTGPAGSGASTITVRPQNGAAGGPPIYSATPVSVIGITPLVVRLELLLHAGARP